MLAPRVESGYHKLGELPGATGHDKVEIWERPGEDGSSLLELVEYAWGSGIGWYVQKRMTLDAGQMEALRALLAPAPETPTPPRLHRPTPPVERDGNVIRLVFSE
jgi:hypothetical protein